jgi:hypothetical protein
MKNLLLGIGLLTLGIPAFAAQPPLNTAINGELAGPNNTISLLRSSPIVDAYLYKTRYANKTKLLYERSDESRGSEV